MAETPPTEDLVLRAEIEDLVVRYATAIDTRTWDLFGSVFAEDADIDYGPMMGRWSTAAQFTDYMREAHLPAGPSVHRMTNIVVTGGEPVSARTYGDSLIQHVDDPKTMDHGAAYYDDTFVRTEQGLRIASRKTTMIFFEQPTTNMAPGFDI